MEGSFRITPSYFAQHKDDLIYLVNFYELTSNLTEPDILYKVPYMAKKYKPKIFDFSKVYSDEDRPVDDCPAETVFTWDEQGVQFIGLYLWLANHPININYFLNKYPGRFLHLNSESSRSQIIKTLYYFPFEIKRVNEILKIDKPITMLEILWTAARYGNVTVWEYIDKFGVPYLYLDDFIQIKNIISRYDPSKKNRVINKNVEVGKKYFPFLYI